MENQQFSGLGLILIASLALLAGCVSKNVDNAGFETVSPTSTSSSNTTATSTTPQTNSTPASTVSTLAGTKWVSTSDNLHTIEFGSDNTVSGLAGCNVYNGFYGEASQGLSFNSISKTKNICAQSIMTKASVFTDLLQRTSNFQKIGETIIMKDKNNTTLLAMKKQAI